MLWLIQRDFLEGKTVQDMVSEALLPVANPYEDQDIAQVRNENTSLRFSAMIRGSQGGSPEILPRLTHYSVKAAKE